MVIMINVHSLKFTISVSQLTISKCQKEEILRITTDRRGTEEFVISNPARREGQQVFYGGNHGSVIQFEEVLRQGEELKITVEPGGQIMAGTIISLKTDNLAHLENGRYGPKKSKKGGV